MTRCSTLHGDPCGQKGRDELRKHDHGTTQETGTDRSGSTGIAYGEAQGLRRRALRPAWRSAWAEDEEQRGLSDSDRKIYAEDLRRPDLDFMDTLSW